MEYLARKEKKDKNIVFLCVGITLFNIGILLVEFFDVNYLLFKLFIYSGVLMSGISMLFSLEYNMKYRSSFFKIIVGLMFLWYFVMALNSDIKFFLNPQSYLMPFSLLCYSMFLLLFLDRESLLRALNVFSNKIYLPFLLLCFIPIFLNVSNVFLQFFLEIFAVGSAFLFISNKYHSNKVIFISGIVLAISLLIATIGARRNVMLTFGQYIFIGSVFLVFNGKVKSVESKIILILMGFLILLGAFKYYESERSGTFSKITSRATENTRDEVFVSFAADMFNVKDLVIGRGFSGEYYCPGVDKDDSGETSDYRKNIECAYLQWILNGGLVYLILYLTLFIYAIFSGFKSSNQLLKGFACILIVQLVDMFPFGLHAFNMKTFLIWTSVSICLDEKFRKMSDEEIMNVFFKQKRLDLPWKK